MREVFTIYVLKDINGKSVVAGHETGIEVFPTEEMIYQTVTQFHGDRGLVVKEFELIPFE